MVDPDSRGYPGSFGKCSGRLTGTFGQELSIPSRVCPDALALCSELRPAAVTIDQHSPVAQNLDHQRWTPQGILQRHNLQNEARALAQTLGQRNPMVQSRLTQRDDQIDI